MNQYTKIPNEIFEKSQLRIQERYLYCLLLKYCGKEDRCFPSQKTMANILGITERHIRTLINNLITAGIVDKRRYGWNRANTYTVSKDLKLIERKQGSYHLGSKFPIHQGNSIPPKSTYLKGKGKSSLAGLEKMRQSLTKKHILSLTKPIIER